MSERLLPISQKQHEAVQSIVTQRDALNSRLSIMAATIIAGTDEDMPSASVEGSRLEGGRPVLVLTVPDGSAPAP